MEQSHDVAEFPNVVTDSGGHRGSDSQGLVNAPEVVIHEINRQRVRVVLNFLRKPVGQTSESAHRHSHRKILALNEARRNVFSLWVAFDHCRNRADTLRRTITVLFFARVWAVQFDQHRIINVHPKRKLNGSQINVVAVRGELHAIGESRSQIVHEVLRVPRGAASNAPARNQLGVSIQRCPRPNVSIAELSALVGWYVLILRVAKAPNLVALNSLARQIAERSVLIFRTCAAKVGEQLNNCVLRNARHSHGGANRIAFYEGRKYLNLAFNWEAVHA